ncbi:hypothetical protein MYX07_05405 [Patescibacteria group bacterium AH-259-L07]|nr:hypothetical protein [Patescibacteria group bacterium AH-259-L07]
MDPVVFWGIEFRNASHMVWFQMSMGFFALGILWFLVWRIIPGLKARTADSLFSALAFWVYAAGSHGVASLGAIIETKGGTIITSMYSPDCIWFNALMAGIYIGLCCLSVVLINRKLQPKTG